mmetsp:Transcript_32103/g.66396  ORF Transcript_32103/g.66396 Transcript_32103/m.66396 type:complete len:83 (+) Transcript_32103:1428-1676(+)
MGRLGEFHASICFCERSTTQTRILGHLAAITAMVGPPTYPAPIQQILRSHSDDMIKIDVDYMVIRSERKKKNVMKLLICLDS